MMINQDLERLQRKLGYQFQQQDKLELALTHRSAAKPNNERLEFLGDSILNLTIAEALYQKFPCCNEGELSRMRAALVQEATLAKLAKQFQLGDYIYLGAGELKSGGFRRDSILADCVEAIIGAISLDSSLLQAVQLVQSWFAKWLEDIKPGDAQKDAKTRLQEYLQGKHLPLPQYDVINITGEAHNQTFYVECRIQNLEKIFKGTGTSRRKAEQATAGLVLQELEKNEK